MLEGYAFEICQLNRKVKSNAGPVQEHCFLALGKDSHQWMTNLKNKKEFLLKHRIRLVIINGCIQNQADFCETNYWSIILFLLALYQVTEVNLLTKH